LLFEKLKFLCVFRKNWYFSDIGEIRNDEDCLGFIRRNGPHSNLLVVKQLFLDTCHGSIDFNQKWSVNDNGSIQHSSGYCLDILVQDEKDNLVMAECEKNKESQKWIWNRNEKRKL
jgi:hypothetical protein